MKPVFSPAILDKIIKCPQCEWEGKGDETVQEAFELEESIELHCVSCDYYFGLIDTAGN